MTTRTINTRIKNKRDTNSNLERYNPVLLNGEIVIVDHEIEGLKIKFGDGVSTYSQLPFYGAVYSEKPVYAYYEIQGLSDILNELNSKIELTVAVPSGMIMLWSGSKTNIPDGWVLCDGTNNTPDLTDKFVLGAGKTYNIGDTGGEAAHILTVDEIPSHSHLLTRPQWSRTEPSGTETNVAAYGVTNKTDTNLYEDTEGNIANTGGSQSHNNMPPYYALCYIMKI